MDTGNAGGSRPFIGSFLSVLAVRLPEGRGVVAGRSACPACGAALRARDLVPVLSFAVLRGRCRDCGGAISPLYPALELGALGLALWSLAAVPGPIVWWSCLLGWALLALAAIDLRCWRLPDVLTLPLGAAGLVFAELMLPGRLGEQLIGAVAGFGLIFAVDLVYQHWRGRIGLGRGDAKLLAAGGAWVGWAGSAGSSWSRRCRPWPGSLSCAGAGSWCGPIRPCPSGRRCAWASGSPGSMGHC
ncbi:prepilin peptidase [Oleomonas cavernae]|uniref:Prepilin leader peptidase/N-methyltransferase n=1 Tax=Oleomonas cavernae TaxID=2320859 RepID=A0A418VUG8_9PROT|nr:A24 family peptidase [Oleomonas cavernae]RJF80807.1 prepilin peptidase [Oleomonas cavernae]